jgi:hypothetical protein
MSLNYGHRGGDMSLTYGIKPTEVELTCIGCGHKSVMPILCPYTGHRYGAGFDYTCPICRGTMEGPDEEPASDD